MRTLKVTWGLRVVTFWQYMAEDILPVKLPAPRQAIRFSLLEVSVPAWVPNGDSKYNFTALYLDLQTILHSLLYTLVRVPKTAFTHQKGTKGRVLKSE